jgi:hypothetical protein
VPLAESIVKLSAVCQGCLGAASFSMRIGDEKELEVIGGAEKYVAVCRVCYREGRGKVHAESAQGAETAAMECVQFFFFFLVFLIFVITSSFAGHASRLSLPLAFHCLSLVANIDMKLNDNCPREAL